MSVAYGAGLRVSEVANLKVTDIESKRMLLRVEQGEGKKDRHAMLSPRLLAILRDYWWVAKPGTWLFPGRDPGTNLAGSPHDETISCPSRCSPRCSEGACWEC
jgi:integrase